MDKVEIKEPQPGQKELTITVSPATVEEELSRIYSELGKSRPLKGFRPGHAPRRLLETHFGKQARSEAVEKLIGSKSSEAIRTHGLEVVGDPAVSGIDLKADNTLSFVISVDLRPRVEIENWQGIPLTKKKVEVREEEVEREMEELLRRSARFEPEPPRPLQADDWALVVSRPQSGAKGEEQPPLLLEMGKIPEDLRSRLLGIKPGEKRTLKGRGGEGKGEAGRGDFEIELKEIKKMILPEKNDEWARSLGDYAGLEKLKEDVREAVRRRKESAAAADLDAQAVRHLLTHSRLIVPPRALKRLEEEYYRAGKGGEPSQEAPAESPEVEKRLREESLRRAEEELRLHFILDELAGREKIEVTEEILQEEINALAARYGAEPAAARGEMETRGEMESFKERIRKRLILTRVVEKASVKEVN